ncbi:molybdenum cofactor guanylyltransferase [Tamlana crocina]|uniref:Probable molybdenum cofactor guanylyltransferase n=1 Tax=Tamlana crocina TaxID=393006 RepID=A0ABX1DAN8_9FLAO|nr:molybdenum cofactor guanylyltransferase [Tamlana crocina]NJX14189.1 molybdenum cofactor guanylyltransferase [Tamlana crocina]
MIEKNNITGIILAGGKSSRMGTDKGLLLFNDKPFVQQSIDALSPLVSEIIIVSDRTDYDRFGFKRIKDEVKDAGPVSGIHSGLKASTTTFNLVLSCDIPLITTKILRKLIEHADGKSEIIQIESNGKSMPLIALYKRDVKDKFQKLLQQDERRLRVAVQSCIVKNVVLEDDLNRATTNVNTKEELKQLNSEYNH